MSASACRAPAPAIAARYVARDLGVVQCPAPAGFTLLLVSSQEHSWIDLHRGKAVWSSEQAVVYRQGAGNFPNVSGSVTWLRAPGKRWRGMVFAVASRDAEDARRLTFFAVSTLGASCLVGTYPARAEAESAIMRGAACLDSLR